MARIVLGFLLLLTSAPLGFLAKNYSHSKVIGVVVCGVVIVGAALVILRAAWKFSNERWPTSKQIHAQADEALRSDADLLKQALHRDLVHAPIKTVSSWTKLVDDILQPGKKDNLGPDGPR